MSASDDEIPAGVIRLRVRGDFKLTRPAQGEVDGWQVLYLNAKRVDWTDACNAARAQLFPEIKLRERDPVFDEIMRARLERP